MKFGAIDAGGKKFICGITDEQGNTLEKTSFLTETPEKTIPLVIPQINFLPPASIAPNFIKIFLLK